MGITPKNSPYILGIDLGTSNSAIAIFMKGRPEIIPIDGEKMCPSVVSVGKDGEMLVGRTARKRLMLDPDNAVASIKREMGGSWKKEFSRLSGKEYTPVDISAEILTKLVSSTAEAETIDLRGTPRHAVICIPANFNDAQKTATIEAARLANLDVLHLLEEPVAAAIAYGMEKERDQTILVYDLGGGTFDVSILNVDSTKGDSSKFEILAKEGVPKLGGDDFDYKIMEMAVAKLKEETGLDILDLKKDQGIKTTQLREAQQKLKEAAETAKCELSEAKTTRISLPNLIKDESGNLHSLDIEITREQFNEAIQELIMQSKEAVEKALASAKLTIDDISRIILIGGSTRAPLVGEMLTNMFGKEPFKDTDPDTAVARGAAIFGATLGVPTDQLDRTEATRPEDKPKGSITIINIVTHFLGMEIKGGKFSCLLEKGKEISPDAPLAISKEYTTQRDDMTELMVRVYQSDRPTEFVGTEGVECIGEFFLTGIPAKPQGQERIAVSFEIDQQNLLKVKATSSSSSGELEIKRS